MKLRDGLYDLAFCATACAAVVGLAVAHCGCAAVDNALGGPAPVSETYQGDPFADDRHQAPLYLRRLDAGADR